MIKIFHFHPVQKMALRFVKPLIDEEKKHNFDSHLIVNGIKNYNKELLRQKVTSDFIIFEMGERFSLDEFTNFIESSGFLEWESTNWVLSDFIVSIDVSSAHVSYLNTGTFIYPNPYKEGVTLKEDKKW